ncbi:uncharacterized protein MELLADRAFT_41772 [Melampsora larici-populina 98AG31]|uniref:tRNA-binding domain-containing protein n=1 Tax=Melampsora larici-populina (strain 98AG31 / pathotype 3-4-7) TaxID=747676 RepID=F4R5K6_MELLP|nr:uncharacterized protein MELLADRAFT_41772 [Melampsora larici-populina 98AG31]EGG12244.1 hypothetical protein MELLADRAFT_41772 [Melampsora larici-populina 98AG31]
MSNIQLNIPNSDVTLHLIIEIFLKNSLPNLVLETSSKELSLQVLNESDSVIGLSSILETLNQKHCPGLIASNDDEKKVAMSWLKSMESFEIQKPQVLKELDSYLQSRTFMIGKGLTAIDLVVFTKLHSYIKGSVQTDLTNHPSITRHFDFIQNYPSVQTAIQTTTLSKIPINVEDVPEIPRPQVPPPIKKDKKETKVNENGSKGSTSEVSSKPTPNVSGEGNQSSKKKEKEKKKDEGKKAAGSTAVVVEGPPMPHMIDMRVGKIVHVEKHPDADSLYVEKIDFGEPELRTVVSGLVNYIPIEEMKDKVLVGICNLKPANMRGVKSFAMVLAATSKDGKDGKGSVELIEPPVGSLPGDRVYFEGFENEKPIEQLNPKKKQFEMIQPNFTTLESKEACWKDPNSNDNKVYRIRTDKGICFSPNFIGASLS